MEYEHELYAERLRLEAQAAGVAAGKVQWTSDPRDTAVRVKLDLAWQDATAHRGVNQHLPALEEAIRYRTVRSLARQLEPRHMVGGGHVSVEDLLSLIEAEHLVLRKLAEARNATPDHPNADWRAVALAAENFRSDVNRIFESYLVGYSLTQASHIITIESQVMHNAVVAPTLHLLHEQPRFAAAEAAYQKALTEIRNGDAGDAITDAATALQEALTAAGCDGKVLGDLLSSAKKRALLGGADNPLADAIVKAASWVAAKRNQGEAHRGDPDINMSDAWTVVHIVGALIVRLSESSPVNGN